jgi:hypothetical protein
MPVPTNLTFHQRAAIEEELRDLKIDLKYAAEILLLYGDPGGSDDVSKALSIVAGVDARYHPDRS